MGLRLYTLRERERERVLKDIKGNNLIYFEFVFFNFLIIIVAGRVFDSER